MTDRPTEAIAPTDAATPPVTDAPPQLDHLYRLWRLWCMSAEMSRQEYEAEPTQTSFGTWLGLCERRTDAHGLLIRELRRLGRGRRWRIDDTVFRIMTEASGNRREHIVIEEAPR